MSSKMPFLVPLTESLPDSSRVVTSSDGTRIHYDFYDAPSPWLVLVVPGFWRSRGYPSMRRLGGYLRELGYRAAIMDVRGHGDSEGTFGFNLHEYRDVEAVANHLLASFPIEGMTLIGFSVGGSVATSAAARLDLPLKSLLLISCVAKVSKVIPRINPFTIHRHIAVSQALRRPRFTWGFAMSEKLCALDDICHVHAPVCLIHVKKDWLVDHSHSVALYEKANEPKELHVLDIPGHYHADRIFAAAPGRAESIIENFLTATLQS